MPRKLTAALTVCLAALGLAAGLFAFPAHADTRSDAYAAVTAEINALPASGYTLGTWARPSPNGHLCTFIVVENANGVVFIGEDRPLLGDLNPDNADYCASSPDEIHARIVTLLATWPPPAPATTTTTAAATTAAATTTTDTTTATTTTATVSVSEPPAATVTVADPTLQTQIDALNAKVDALTTRVDKIAAANTASWTAFSDALTAGQSPADAALAARSAGLNSLYSL